jgi:PIN domain nuclease of toxin-antitoxin system
LIYLDTHIVVWLYIGEKNRFSEPIQALMNQHDWLISPIVRLELQYLHEIGRMNLTADAIISDLSQKMGLSICAKPFNTIVSQAMQMTWTRDPFDRILVAQAALNNNILITSDQKIQQNYPYAQW